MAKKTETDPIVDELKKLLVADKVTMGADRALEGLRNGKVSRVYMASNYPDEKRQDILRYAELSGAEVVILKFPNDELGTVCKKPFSVSVLSVAK